MNKDLTTPASAYSFWPIFLAFGILLIVIGVVWAWGISILGLLLMLASIIGWVWENRAEREQEQNE